MKKDMSFEKAINELENIIQQLESGEITLDKSIKLFTEGAQLLNMCNAKLQDAKLKIEELFPREAEEDY